MNFICKISILLIILVLSGCASGLSVHKFSDSKIDINDKTLVLLNDSPWATYLRLDLAKNGFKVKKFASRKSIRKNVVSESSEGLTEDESSYREAEARYGVTLTQIRTTDWCPFNENVKADFSLEVSDLKTNDVVLVIAKGNWTGVCGPFSIRSKYLFEELSDELSKNWN
ncbi:MAG: hypothetical protein Q8O24_01710 [Gallionellaceae bacterium]|nr:hypothetical protein [Gallionellaceae bacterium]